MNGGHGDMFPFAVAYRLLSQTVLSGNVDRFIWRIDFWIS
jgi:hypothetical protein